MKLIRTNKIIELSNKNGVTLVALAITLVIMAILSVVAINLGTDSIETSRDAKLVSELGIVQHAVLEQYAKYEATKDTSYLVGDKINKSIVKQIASQLEINLANIPASYANQDYYKLNNESLKKIGIKDADEYEDIYIVNYVSGEVINMSQLKTSIGSALYVRGSSFVNK